MKTIRQQMMALLREREMDARELSRALGIKEKEIYPHLVHAAKSAAAGGGRLIILPAVCRSCGFTFTHRRRFTRPGRCPHCKQTRVEAPAYRID